MITDSISMLQTPASVNLLSYQLSTDIANTKQKWMCFKKVRAYEKVLKSWKGAFRQQKLFSLLNVPQCEAAEREQVNSSSFRSIGVMKINAGMLKHFLLTLRVAFYFLWWWNCVVMEVESRLERGSQRIWKWLGDILTLAMVLSLLLLN